MIICDHNEYKAAAEFYAKKLSIPDDTIIAIGLYETLPISGYCEFHEEEVLPYFLIGLDIGDDLCDDPLAVLAHEMVHVQQYVTGDLVDHNSYCMWKGVRYEDAADDSEEYFFSPWEVMAYGMQVGLTRLYYRSLEECPTQMN